LHNPGLFLARRAFARDPRSATANREPDALHPHDLAGNPIRLMLKQVVHLSDDELCLYDT
jgi:hypothetical protein